jgi:predicted RNase H-like nuclease (RuvC/YqgF family)/cbb3-type cytochrome oxidase subunit 3
MRRALGFVLALVAIVFLGATIVTYSKYKKTEADYARATAEGDSTRQRYDQAVGEIVSIQDSLNAIVLGENGGQFVPAQPLDEMQPPGTLHDTVLARISSLKAAISRTKDRIEELDKNLKKSGVKVASLERMVAGLRKSVGEKESRIAELSTQVDTLQTRVAGLNADVETKQAEIVQKQTELATVYYTMGTKKELTNSGVVKSKGGVLGIGKTVEPTGVVNEAAFKVLDTDQENVIRIPAEKAQVLTPQPVTSYVLTPVSKELVELRILDPKEFRKVRHLVILMT